MRRYTDAQRHRGTEIQRHRCSKVQRYRDLEAQRYEGTEAQGQALTVRPLLRALRLVLCDVPSLHELHETRVSQLVRRARQAGLLGVIQNRSSAMFANDPDRCLQPRLDSRVRPRARSHHAARRKKRNSIVAYGRTNEVERRSNVVETHAGRHRQLRARRAVNFVDQVLGKVEHFVPSERIDQSRAKCCAFLKIYKIRRDRRNASRNDGSLERSDPNPQPPPRTCADRKPFRRRPSWLRIA